MSVGDSGVLFKTAWLEGEPGGGVWWGVQDLVGM